MESFLFFPSNNHDRISKSKDIANFLSQLFTNGIFNNKLKILANNDMTVTVTSGYAFINGHFYHNDSDKILSIDTADKSLSRIDSIILRYSEADRNIIAQVLPGTASINPKAPEISNLETLFDLRLANINVKSGIGLITQDLIEDTRFGNECGNVTQAVLSLDTSDIFNQYQTLFYNWFNNLKTNLDEDAAGCLQNEIDSFFAQIGDLENLSTQTKESVVNAINELIDTYSYDLITDGDPVKTGRRIDGKDEYVKRITTSITQDTRKRVLTGLTEGDVKILDYNAMITSDSISGIQVKTGFFNGVNNFFASHVIDGVNIQLITGSESTWITSDHFCVIDIYYVNIQEVIK